MSTNYYSKDLTATTTAQFLEVNIEFKQLAIFNDSESGVLNVSFGGDVADSYIPIMPGDSLELNEAGCSELYYKSSIDNVDFRLFGIIHIYLKDD